MDTLLFYTPGTCALACIVSLEWLGEPYRLCRVEGAARSSDAYRIINPRAQVPAIRVDGRTLVEANGILAHIADRRPELRLLPVNGSWERDVANQWLAYLASGFHAVFWPYFRPDRYTTEAAHEASIKAAAERSIRRELAALDRHLDGRDWILGDGRSVLDAYVHAMDRWANPFVEMAKEFPYVWRHQKAMASDPAVRFAIAVERNADADRAESSCTGHVALDDVVQTVV
jgi:glutathione S-transferase